MPARNKLNGAYLNGALILAGIAALIAGNGTTFVVGFVLLVVVGFVSGELRARRRSQ